MSESVSNKPNKQSVEDELKCPISWDLPIDPVKAEDGFVYERAAIQKHLSGKKKIKSPMTNLQMGDTLAAHSATKNKIETLIKTGSIPEELAKNWKERLQQQQKLKSFLKKAEQGDLKAIEEVACHYFRSNDHTVAYEWFSKAARKGSIESMALLGALLLSGNGVAQNESEGIMYVSMAAGKGSHVAASYLGDLYFTGNFGFPLDQEKAAQWYKKALEGPLPEEDKKLIQKRVDELEN